MPGSRHLSLAALVALGAIQAIWPLTMDLYLPAFPDIRSELATTPGFVQLTLTGAFLGMAVGQLAAGPLSDRIGRMRPLVVVLALYAVATVACALAPNIEALIGARVVQGAGAAASSVIVLAIVRDAASGSAMVRLLARLQLVNGFFVVTSPALGALLLGVVDWRGIFVVLVAYAVLLLIAALAVLVRHETHPPERRALRAGARLIDDYRVLARDRVFVAVVLAGGLQWAAMMAYMASSAFLFQEVYGITPVGYAILFGGHGLLMIIGAQLSARWSPRRGMRRVLRAGSAVLALTGVAIVVIALAAPDAGIVGFVLPLFVFTTAFGVVSPTIQSTALESHGLRAGTAGSLLGATNMVFGAVSAPLVTLIGPAGAVSIGVVMAGCAALAAVVVVWVVRGEPANEGSAA